MVLSCIDSRLPPELVFDRGLGDLLVVRSAAHSLDDIVLGSVEYGPCVLGAPLILVLGHRGCGAAAAAVAALAGDHRPPGHLEDIVEAMRPAYNLAVKQPGAELIDHVVRAHTLLTAARLRRGHALAGLLGHDRLAIVAGCCHLGTGVVDIIG